MTEPAHHAWGPSSLKQKINCLGSDQATRGLPDVDSDASLSGTATHLLVQKCRELNVPAKKYLGHTITVITVDDKSREFLVDQARVDSAQTFIDHINGLPGIDFNEQRIRYPRFIPGGFGTLDGARAPNDGTVYIRDFKDGGLLVYAVDNEQLLGCALGFLEEWGHLFKIDKFNLGIVQPRRDHIDIWEVSAEYVLEWAEKTLKPAYARAQEPNPPFNPGDWCTFCKIKGTCTTRIASLFDTVVGDFDDIEDAVTKEVVQPSRLSNEHIALILPKIPAMKACLNDIEKYAFAQVRAGEKVGSYKIVDGNLGDRKFVAGAEGKLRAEANAMGGIDGDAAIEALYEPRKLKGPAQVEKVLGKKRFKPATDTKPAGDLNDLIYRPPGAPQLVPGDDPRPPKVFDAASVFEDVEEDFE
jgi:hypothetical protein